MQLFVCLFPLKTTLELQLLKIDEMLISKEKDVTEKTLLFRVNFLVSSLKIREICIEIKSS